MTDYLGLAEICLRILEKSLSKPKPRHGFSKSNAFGHYGIFLQMDMPRAWCDWASSAGHHTNASTAPPAPTPAHSGASTTHFNIL